MRVTSCARRSLASRAHPSKGCTLHFLAQLSKFEIFELQGRSDKYQDLSNWPIMEMFHSGTVARIASTLENPDSEIQITFHKPAILEIPDKISTFHFPLPYIPR